MSATPEQCRRYRARLKMRSLAQIGNRCERCGSRSHIERAHRRPTDMSGEGRGSTHRYLDVVQHPECYYALCRQCNLADR